MSLKIVKATDVVAVEQIIVTIYGAPGVGKTSLGFTAHAPLMLDFDAGAYRAFQRGDSVSVKSWEDVANITAADLEGVKTLVIDTAGRGLDALTADIIAKDPKAGRGGALTLQGYGTLKTRFASWLKLVRSFGLDIVLLAHSDEQRNGDDVTERIDAQGGSKGEIYKSSDAMGRLLIRDGKRMLLFSPTDTAFGKNPAQLPPLEVPRFAAGGVQFLGDVIRDIKAHLNRMSANQVEVTELLTQWKAAVMRAESVEDVNALRKMSADLDHRIRDNGKRLLLDHAKSLGFIFDTILKEFTFSPTKAEPKSDVAPPEAYKGQAADLSNLFNQTKAKRDARDAATEKLCDRHGTFASAYCEPCANADAPTLEEATA